MWKGKWDDRMKELFLKYDDKFGCEPDTYEDILYEAMSYDEFCKYIEESLNQGKEIDDVVE